MYIWLAPMDGITDAAYRGIVENLFFQYWNKKDKLVLTTEFMSAHWFVANPVGVAKHLLILQQNYKLDNLVNIAQIFGADKEKLIYTAKWIYENLPQYDLVELNIWCPSPKICSTGAGSAMLKDKKATLNIIKQLSNIVNGNFTIKTRIWLTDQDKDSQFEFLLEAAKYCKIITIHWRTFQQWHTGSVDWEFIYRLKSKVWNNVLVIWNWWIKSYQEAVFRKENLDGVSIWQASIGNPWIFVQKDKKDISILERLNLVLHHFDWHLKQYIWYEFVKKLLEWKSIEKQLKLISDRNLLLIAADFLNQNVEKLIEELNISDYSLSKPAKEFRKHLFAYLKWYSDSRKFKQKLIEIDDYRQVIEEIKKFMKN